jgi:hypothetical protein
MDDVVEVVGLLSGDGTRNCVSHAICGELVTVQDTLQVKKAVMRNTAGIHLH